MSCLVDHRGNISEYQCNQYITKMTSIIFSDYRLICGFMDKCKEDVNNLHCGSINVGHKVGSGRDKLWLLLTAHGCILYFLGVGLLSRTSTHKVR